MTIAQYFYFDDDSKRLEKYEACQLDQLISAAIALGRADLQLDQALRDGRKNRVARLVHEVARLQNRVAAFRKAVGE